MHVHFIAVAGTGMGALAGLFKAAGHDVSVQSKGRRSHHDGPVSISELTPTA